MKLNNFFNDINESVLDPIHEDLSKDIWTKTRRLKPDVRNHILSALKIWLSLYTNEEPKNVYLAGSMTGYQYTSYSDIDVNVVIDLPDDKIKAMSKLLPNGNNLPKTEHPVNYYIANKFQLEEAGSLYDIVDDKWKVKPEKKDVNVHHKAVLEITISWMRKIDLDVNELKRDVMEYKLYEDYLTQQDLEIDVDEVKQYLQLKEIEIKADIDTIHITYHMIKQFRKEAFKEKEFKSSFLTQVNAINANYAINNLVYKTLERFGYLDILHKYAGMEFEDALKLKAN